MLDGYRTDGRNLGWNSLVQLRDCFVIMSLTFQTYEVTVKNANI
jgi:hypothetical protein